MSNQQPRQLTKEAREKKFTMAATREELLVIRMLILQHHKEYGLGDQRIFLQVFDKCEQLALPINENDYEPEEATPEVTLN